MCEKCIRIPLHKGCLLYTRIVHGQNVLIAIGLFADIPRLLIDINNYSVCVNIIWLSWKVVKSKKDAVALVRPEIVSIDSIFCESICIKCVNIIYNYSKYLPVYIIY